VKIITTTIATSLVLLSSSSFAYHELNVENHANVYATAKTRTSPCSSLAGSTGILKPHGNLTVSDFVMGMYCNNQCDVDLYLTKNCSGPSASTAHVKHDDGVVSISNHNQGNVHVTGSGFKITLEDDSAKSNSVFDFLTSWTK
jgi:hypothetical protein